MVVWQLRSTGGIVGRSLGGLVMGGLAIAATACGQPSEPTAQAQQPGGQGQGGDRPTVVDIATAASAAEGARVYTGTTRPARQVSLRSQAEGRLLNLSVDVGDAVGQGQVVGRLDGGLLQTAVGEAQAELAARQFEVAQAEAELADIRTSIEAARAQLQQASNDAQRLQTLAAEGAIAAQQAEQAQTSLRSAEQTLASSQEQVRTRQQAVAAAQQRVEAQRAILREAQQRLAFANLTASLGGVVLERAVEPGDLVLPGEAILTLGDLSQIHVVIEVADSNLGEFSLGQTVQLAIDAFAGETFVGRVSRISPVADSTSRLLPVEITVDNPGGRVGSGLLARVTGTGDQASAVLVPESALEAAAPSDNSSSDSPTGDSSTSDSQASQNQIFVVTEANGDTVVEARAVQVGDRADGQVTILSGLAPGEQYVVRSSQPLEPGQAVEPSLLSEG